MINMTAMMTVKMKMLMMTIITVMIIITFRGTGERG